MNRTGISKPKYVVQGNTFELKPTSKNVRREIERLVGIEKERIAEIYSAINSNSRREAMLLMQEQGEYDPDLSGPIPEEVDVPEYDEYDLYLTMFCALTTGPHDLIDPDEFDIKFAEQAKADFTPAVERTATQLIESLI